MRQRPTDGVTSIILSGLQGNNIIIHKKVNHVLIRKSNGITLDIKQGTVSGVDILYCRFMLIRMPCYNFTNLEFGPLTGQSCALFGEGIYFQAEVNDVSQLHITGSLDVKVCECANVSIPINPFIDAIFTKNGWFYKKQHDL